MVLLFPEFLRLSENSKCVVMKSFTLCCMLLSDAASLCTICYCVTVMLSIAIIIQCIVRFEVSTAVMLNIKFFWNVNVLADV
jgi:hypothetical protein